MLSSICLFALVGSAVAAAAGCPAPTAPPSQPQGKGKLQFIGTNEAGAEFGQGSLPGTYGRDFMFPDLNTISTFVGKGFNVFRVPFLMERLTPGSIGSGIDYHYLKNLTNVVNGITQKGAFVILDPHNFGRYNGQIITDTTAFNAWWNKVATQFKSNSKVIFDVNNEFNNEPGALVAALNQAAINGIRASGAVSQYIAVEGNSWTGAWTWTTATGTDGKTNAQTMGGLTDPSGKLIYEMHQYLDGDASGTSPTCVDRTIGSSRLVAATNWLRANGKKGMIGEFAGGVNDVCKSAVTDMLQYLGANNDVWMGAVWWAAGPWWGSYLYNLEPNGHVAYDMYTPILAAMKQ